MNFFLYHLISGCEVEFNEQGRSVFLGLIGKRKNLLDDDEQYNVDWSVQKAQRAVVFTNGTLILHLNSTRT